MIVVNDQILLQTENRFDVNDTIIHTSIALHRKKSLHLTPYKAAEEKTVMV